MGWKLTDRPPPICDYEGSDYQETFWDAGGRAYEDRCEEIALRRLLPTAGELLLEIGAGAGRNTPRYKNYRRVVLLDYSRTQLQRAQERLGSGNGRYIYVAADVYALPFVAGLFDAATMIRTLHHMADAPRALQQVRQVLRPGAVFILEYANKRNLKAIIRYWLRYQAWSPFSLAPVEFARLNFDFHPRAIRRWLQDNRFAAQRTLTVSHLRVSILKRVLPTGVLVGIDSLAQLTGDWWQLSPSVFVRAEALGPSPIASPGEFFRCPACQQARLVEHPGSLTCSACSREWPVEAGIYDFRVR